jgi:hypothetical protein
MAERSLPDILNDCVDRLAAGQTIADCLLAYPGQAARLGSMLESGLIAARVVYPAGDVALAQERIWSRMEQAYNAPAPVRPLRLPQRWVWAIAAAAALLVLAGVMLAAQNSRPGDPLYGVRVYIESIFSGGQPAPLPIATETAAPTATSTLPPTATATKTLTSTPTMTETAVPSATLTATAAGTATPAVETIIPSVIEGPVQAIDGNVITIYGIEIAIDEDDPLLDVIVVGDVIRVEGDFDGAAIDASNVVVIDAEGAEVEIFTSDTGEVWRDDGTCNNPPPDWAPANGWRRRCQGGNGSVEPGSRGQGNGSGNSNGSANGNGNGNSGRGNDDDDD